MSNRNDLRPGTRKPHPRGLERLEDRCLLSAAHGLINTITFAQAPTAVQTGLDALAASDSLAAPTAAQSVYLGNVKGVETYTIDLSSTGTSAVLTVNQKGAAVSPPVYSTTTFGAITNAAVTAEFTALAAALNLTAPASTTNVSVQTNADSTAVYTIQLASATSTGRHPRMMSLAVDSLGNPTGNESVPLSTLSTAIQAGLTSNAPAGAAALTAASPVAVKTLNGVTTYSATYQSTGIRTTVTVDNTGALANLPSTSTVKFADLATNTQNELQALAAANGYVGTISATQSVSAYDEANGTIIYSVRLPVTGTGHSGATYTYMIAVAADQNGNPTVPPGQGPGGFGGFGGFGGWGFGGWGFGGPGGGGFSAFTGFSRYARAMGFRF